MRGKVYAAVSMPDTVRITPAYAGKSPTVGTCKKPVTDHPRLCGEKDTNNQELTFTGGSPPPMRGKGIDTVQYGRFD